MRDMSLIFTYPKFLHMQSQFGSDTFRYSRVHCTYLMYCISSVATLQRWIPVRGWSDKHLLPIDPPPWSSETGARPLVKGSVRLLSENWKWDGDWYVDENVGGFITDKGVSKHL